MTMATLNVHDIDLLSGLS